MNATETSPAGRACDAPAAPRILIVEDERTVRLVCRFALRDQGWEVHSEGVAAAGLEVARAGAFDLLVLDQMMPGLDGLGLVRALGEPAVRPPVLLMSAHADGAIAAEALRLGVVDFLAKPLVPAELRARVRRIFAAREHGKIRRPSPTEPTADETRLAWALACGRGADWPAVREFVRALPAGERSPGLLLLAGVACDLLGDATGAETALRAARFPANWRHGGPEIFAEFARRL